MSLSKKKWTIGVIIILLAIAGIGFGFSKYKASSKPSFREVPIKRDTIAVNILSTGTVQPENRLEIKPPIAGRVETVLVKEGQWVKKGQLLAWMSSTERAALIDAARSKGPEELKRWEELYRSTPVLAPISGTIILRNVESGQTFTNNDSILVMSDRLTVKAQVDETDLAQIKLKQSAQIVLDAYANEKIAAHVDQIAFEAKTVSNVTTYIVDVLPDKTPIFMRSGMTANVTFFVNTKTDVLVVPAEALKINEGKTTVQVKGPSGEPVERIVSIGLSDGKKSEVIDGLREGESILLPMKSRDSKDAKAGANPFSPMGGGTRPRGGVH